MPVGEVGRIEKRQDPTARDDHFRQCRAGTEM
jgi:hypothetical protein